MHTSRFLRPRMIPAHMAIMKKLGYTFAGYGFEMRGKVQMLALHWRR